MVLLTSFLISLPVSGRGPMGANAKSPSASPSFLRCYHDAVTGKSSLGTSPLPTGQAYRRTPSSSQRREHYNITAQNGCQALFCLSRMGPEPLKNQGIANPCVVQRAP